MSRAILTGLFLISTLFSRAQFEYFTVNSDLFTFYPLEGLGESIGKPESTIAFGHNTNGDSLVMAILGDSKEALVIGFVQNDMFNYAKMNEPSWRNDTVFLGSEMPFRATQVTFEFVWDAKVEGFFATESETYDPSWEAVERADSMMAAGNLRGAINSYYMVFYPHAYINEGEVGMNLMELAHKKALAFFKESKFDSSVLYMEMALDYYPNSNYTSFKDLNDYNSVVLDTMSWQEPWSEDKIKLWLGDYGLFLYKAKKYPESIEFNKYLNMILPNVAGPYLQLGDSYYDSGKKTEARSAYKKYAELKKKQGKEKDIPKRVKERMK